MSELRMFKCEMRNPKTGEVAHFLGQGKTLEEATKEGWENACEDFGKSSSGAPPISRARLAVELPIGERVIRFAKAFNSGVPYDWSLEEEFAPGTAEDLERLTAILNRPSLTL